MLSEVQGYWGKWFMLGSVIPSWGGPTTTNIRGVVENNDELAGIFSLLDIVGQVVDCEDHSDHRGSQCEQWNGGNRYHEITKLWGKLWKMRTLKKENTSEGKLSWSDNFKRTRESSEKPKTGKTMALVTKMSLVYGLGNDQWLTRDWILWESD